MSPCSKGCGPPACPVGLSVCEFLGRDHEHQLLPRLAASRHTHPLRLPGPAAGAGPAAERPGALGAVLPPAPVDGDPRLHGQPGLGRPLPAVRHALHGLLADGQLVHGGHGAVPGLPERLPGQQVHEHRPDHGHRRGPLRGRAAPPVRPQAALPAAGRGRVRGPLGAGGRLPGAPLGPEGPGGWLLLREPRPAAPPHRGLLPAGLLPATGRAAALLLAGGGCPGPEARHRGGPGGGHPQGYPHGLGQPGRVCGLLPALARGADVAPGHRPAHLRHQLRPLRHQQGLGRQLLPGRCLLLLHGHGVPGGVRPGQEPWSQGPQGPGLSVCDGGLGDEHGVGEAGARARRSEWCRLMEGRGTHGEEPWRGPELAMAVGPVLQACCTVRPQARSLGW